MPRPALPPAMKDTLLAAVVAKLPEPGSAFTSAEREAWFDMMRKAVDVAYGPVPDGAIPLLKRNAEVERLFQRDAAPDAAPAARIAPARFYIDHDGFALRDGHPIDPTDLPASAILWDERTGIDHGNADAIMWKTSGSNRQPLPAGVQLRAAEARRVNGEAMT
jgi:hypothetical protein